MPNKITDADIISILSLSPQSCKELSRFLGMNQKYIGRKLMTLVEEGKIVRKKLLKRDARVPVYVVVKKEEEGNKCNQQMNTL